MAAARPTQLPCQVVIKTLRDSELAIGRYPKFAYNSTGGGGGGIAEKKHGGLCSITFDAQQLYIPDVCFTTTKVFGVPLPPGVRIRIQPKTFQGTLNLDTGQIDMEFYAQFEASLMHFYKAPALEVKAAMTTEPAADGRFSGRGQRMDKNGKARLIAIATVPRTDSAFVNGLLRLPTQALAIMSAEFSFDSQADVDAKATADPGVV